MEFYLTTSASTFPCFQITWNRETWLSKSLSCLLIHHYILPSPSHYDRTDLTLSPWVVRAVFHNIFQSSWYLIFFRSGKTNDEIVLEIVSDIQKFLPTVIAPNQESTTRLPTTTASSDPVMEPRSSPSSAIHSVLKQEVFRFTRLLNVIHASLHSLDQSIHGLVLLSVDIEETYKSLLLNQVPSQWQVGTSA